MPKGDGELKCPWSMEFHDIGYQVFRNLIPLHIRSSAQEAVEKVCESIRTKEVVPSGVVYVSELKPHRNPGVDNTQAERVPFILGELPALSGCFKEFILQESLWALAAEILGSEDIVYHFSNVTRKPAYLGPNISWHRDYPNKYICPKDSRIFLRMLIPLEGMTKENGCTDAIAGSHLISDDAAIVEDERKSFAIDDPISLEGSAGDVIVIHPKLLHGGRENRSSRERNLVVIQFGIKTDDYLYLDQELYSGLHQSEISGK
ncbi:MAG: phytanoyl-CoA dioxygenase family protein [Chthoniobacterales bacterium]